MQIHTIKHLIYESYKEAPTKLFGIFGLVNYPFFYLFWKFIPDSRYDDLTLRIIATLLCVGLLFKEQWPSKLKKILPFYWFISIIFCLPFMGTYNLLANHFSGSWILNSILGVLLLLFILDWKSFFVIFPLGVLSGISMYFIGENHIDVSNESLLTVALNTIWVIIVAVLFSRRKTILENEKQKTLKAAAGTIAHEMRTPLATISFDGGFVSDVACALEKFGKTFTGKEKEAFDAEIKDLKGLSESLSRTSRESQNVVTLLLTNLQQDFTHLPCEKLSMKEVLDHALEAFVFKGDGRSKVHVEVEQDFTVKGNRDLLTHVFFNLLKNSLYFIQAAGKGEIFITLREDPDHHTVIFKDTGPGIKKEALPKVLTAFYSQRPHGTGIGLSFCQRVMESMKGTIRVDSTFGEHTTFTLTFPKK